jgi:hypothetical protein
MYASVMILYFLAVHTLGNMLITIFLSPLQDAPEATKPVAKGPSKVTVDVLNLSANIPGR